MTTQATSPAPISVLRRSDAILAAGVVGIVAMMIIPLPADAAGHPDRPEHHVLA